MTRTMYDSITASNIPSTAELVAGYCDSWGPGKLPAWTDADWARFPHAVKVRIAKRPDTNDGHVLDVEPGDANPDQAPGWVTMRRRAGADPTVYCSESAWQPIRDQFAVQGVPEPHWWIAHYDGIRAIPAGAVAKQYTDAGPVDLSIVADYWPGVDPKGPTPMTDPDEGKFADTDTGGGTRWHDELHVKEVVDNPDTGVVATANRVKTLQSALTAHTTSEVAHYNDLATRLQVLQTKVDALASAETTLQKSLDSLGANLGPNGAGLSEAQFTQLGNALGDELINRLAGKAPQTP